MAKKWLALLRGINVGGNNIIKMVDLQVCFERMGFSDVSTYIQTGNVMFNSEEEDREKLISQIEDGLVKSFDYQAKIVLRSFADLENVIEQAPAKFGEESDKYRYDVLFVKEPLTVAEAAKEIEVKAGVDEMWKGEKVVYFRRLKAKASSSYLSKFVGSKLYKEVTIRNWNTTSKIYNKMQNGG